MKQSSLTLPISIVVAGLIIGGLSAGAIIYTNRNVPDGVAQRGAPESAEQGATVRDLQYAPVSDADHIRGSADAPVKLITYSDFDCPFCKINHPTLVALYEAHGGPNFAWVYRHFPLQPVGESSMLQAIASECVALQAGDEGFWAFVDKIYEAAGPRERIDLALLPGFATEAGARDSAAYERCYANNETLALIESQKNNALGAGVTGTPYGFLVSAKPIDEGTRNAIIAEFEKIDAPHLLTFAQNQSAVGIRGAVPLESMQAVLDILIQHNS
jgi:protein-disulfide isomerase